MPALLHAEVEPQTGASLSELLDRAQTSETPTEREAAAWQLFLLATPGVELPDFCAGCAPADVRPLLMIARERSLGRCVLQPLIQMRSESDEAVLRAAVRAQVRLWLIQGDWDSEAARRTVRKHRWGFAREEIEGAIGEFAAPDLETSIKRIKGDQFPSSAWTAPLGFMIYVAFALAVVLACIGFKTGAFLAGMGSFAFHIGRVLLKPGTGAFCPEGRRRRWMSLVTQLEEQTADDPKALKAVERELRALSWRISDQPKEVREAAARLVRRVQEIDRNVGQLPIAAAQNPPTTTTLPVSAAAETDA